MLAEVVSLELALLHPATRAARREVERLLHADFREVGASGRAWERDSVLAALAAAPGETVVATDVSARHVAADVVLITYRATHRGREPGVSLRSSLWCRGEDGWRVLFHQGTPVDPADGGTS